MPLTEYYANKMGDITNEEDGGNMETENSVMLKARHQMMNRQWMAGSSNKFSWHQERDKVYSEKKALTNYHYSN